LSARLPRLASVWKSIGRHFGALDYSGLKRKLYASAQIEAHSRMLHLEFTHSTSFETFVRCHKHAFVALGGVVRKNSKRVPWKAHAVPER
jgi:transposase